MCKKKWLEERFRGHVARTTALSRPTADLCMGTLEQRNYKQPVAIAWGDAKFPSSSRGTRSTVAHRYHRSRFPRSHPIHFIGKGKCRIASSRSPANR